MKGRKPKFQQINELHPSLKNRNCSHSLGAALYISSKGTKHFYESLQLLSEWLPEIYLEEFELIKVCFNDSSIKIEPLVSNKIRIS